MSIKDEDVQRMSQALKSGAKLTSEVCPVCSSPIFEIKGELWCLKCNKKVVKVRENSEVVDAMLPYTLNNLSAVVVEKIEQLSGLLLRLTELSDIKNMADTLSALLSVLSQSESLKEKLRK
ncbi:MAG: hypothetical protein B9J98_03745 [Candidatus Terraquivivens tikiterensis]|uniref:Uncharacterized protein n=1 Tax=Candidatus Terraquivivens tikiterensis TaxID=1980982 RepID=A0A2R7Y5P2_9ARCH|nr:MAG: hypothetical protein B9J98_03745 [Candidatus Terraquivivens tikiterensis]